MNPVDLGRIFEMNPGAFSQAQGMLRQSYQGNETDNQRRAVELAQLQQMNPLKLQQQQLQNEGFGLENMMQRERLPGITADAQSKVRENEVRQKIPIEVELKAKLSEATTKMAENEWKQTVLGINQLAASPSANERKMGRLLQQFLPDMVKQRELLASQEERAAIAAAAKEAAGRESTSRQLAVIRARAAQQREAAARTPRGYQEAATRYRILAEEADDPATKLKYLELASEFEAAAQTQAKASKAGQTTITPEGGLGVIEAKPQLGPRPKAMNYATPENVKEAFKAGKLTREDAAKILREQFGMK